MKMIITSIVLFGLLLTSPNTLAEEGKNKLSQLDFDKEGEPTKPTPTPSDPAAQLIHAITNESQIKSSTDESNNEVGDVQVIETEEKKKRAGPFAPIQ